MWTHLLSVAASATIAVACFTLGAMLVQRARVEKRLPVRFFATFWFGSGAYSLLESGWTAAVMAGVGDLTLGEVVLQLKLLSSITGFAGLVCYLLAIYSGRLRVTITVGIAYFALYVLAIAYYANRDPVGQEMSTWGARLVYANAGGGPLWTLLVVALFVPPILAALAYASLLRFIPDPAGRYRLVVVSFGLVLFFAPTALAWVGGSWAWWGITEKLLALTSTLIVMMAFRPPDWARARFGAQPMVEEGAAWRRAPRPRDEAPLTEPADVR